MSTIVATILRATKFDAPIVLVECAGCGRRYRTKQWPHDVLRRRACFVCGNGRPPKKRAEGTR